MSRPIYIIISVVMRSVIKGLHYILLALSSFLPFLTIVLTFSSHLYFSGCITTAEGSTLVKLGNTTVMCGIKAVKFLLEFNFPKTFGKIWMTSHRLIGSAVVECLTRD